MDSQQNASAGSQLARSLHLHRTVSEETLTSDTISQYSNESVKEVDGRFFEYFSSVCLIPAKDNTDGKTTKRFDSLLQNFMAIESQENTVLSIKERELLYIEVLYTIKHKIGTTDQHHSGMVEELYSYAQKSFNIKPELHAQLLAVTSEEKPPILILNVTLEEARDLEAKDADGFSDPYCMLGIIPGSRLSELSLGDEEQAKDGKHKTVLRKFSSSFRDGFKRKSGKNVQIIPAKFIRVSQVHKNTLNPVWSEKFRFDLEDVKSDRLHIDVWDHDDEESVLDAAKNLNRVASMKGLNRVFKQIAQSARASSGDNVDDFLGCVDIPLHGIPSKGHSEWYDLVGRSSKSKVQGQLRVSLNLATREDRGLLEDDNINDIKQHTAILKEFIDHELRVFVGDRVDWPGLLPTEAKTILHQHAIQGDITPVQEVLCYWIAFSSTFTKQQFNATCLLNILDTLNDKWESNSLSAREEESLGDSFKTFVNYFLSQMEDVRTIYPADQPHILDRFECLLACIERLISMNVYIHCCPFEKDLTLEITARFKLGSKNYFAKVIAAACSNTKRKLSQKLEELTNLTTTLIQDVTLAGEYYQPLLERVLHYNYFNPNYKMLESKLSAEVRRVLEDEVSHVPMTNPSDHGNDARGRLYSNPSTASNNSQGSNPEMVEKINAKKLLISKVLDLYFRIQHFVHCGHKYYGGEMKSLTISKYQDWFSRTIQEWLTLSKFKLEFRIEAAISAEKLERIEDNFECSTSAVDVANVYMRIAEFWQKLKWKNPEESFAFSLKLADDICQSAVLYADLIHNKMKKSSYFDDEGQFDIRRPLCICLNNLEYLRRTVAALPAKLYFDKVIDSMEHHHSIDNLANGEESHFRKVFQSLIDTAMNEMSTKTKVISERVSDRMRPDIKRDVFHLCWAPDNQPVDKAIQHLLDYLDQNLLTLYKYLLHSNFKVLLNSIWKEVLEELEEIVKNDNELNYSFYARLHAALELLVDFFHADNKGLSMKEIQTEQYLTLEFSLKMQKFSTEELITQYYCDLLELQAKHMNEVKPKLGLIGVQSHYVEDQETLFIDVRYCKNILPLDSNGLSDPFIVVELCPKHLFKDCPAVQTTVKKKTLNPIFDEVFECKVTLEQCLKQGACIRFTVIDYDFVFKNDFGGEAYLAMSSVVGIGKPLKNPHGLRPIELPFLQPQTPDENVTLSALTKRTNDSAAQDFVKARLDVAEEAAENIN